METLISKQYRSNKQIQGWNSNTLALAEPENVNALMHDNSATDSTIKYFPRFMHIEMNDNESLLTVIIIRNLLTPQVSNNKQALLHVLVAGSGGEPLPRGLIDALIRPSECAFFP